MITIDNTIATQIRMRDGGRATIGRTQMAPPLSQFVAPATGDVHLTIDAAGALDMGTQLTDVTNDIDGDTRGATPDPGADER